MIDPSDRRPHETGPAPTESLPSLDAADSVLATGGAGFIGTHLVEALAPDHSVTVYDTDRPADGHPPGVDHVTADVRDVSTLRDYVADADVVFHEAAVADVSQSIRRPVATHETNLDGTLSLLECARDTDTRVVFASSAAIYGHPERLPICEDHPKRPTTPYGLEKLAADQYTRLYADLYDVETVALRYFNVYGPRQGAGDYSGVITTFVRQALAGEDLTVHGDGEQTRDFVFVEDIVRANLLAATTDAVGESYNVGTGESVTIRELAALIRRLSDADVDIVHTESRAGDIDHSVADSSKAERRLDFEPTVSLEAGLDRTIAWFEASD
ncbi:NAD-dependent epimerase/dehydratase family protein [Salinirubrum litoreum]|uniref:NAD-dependent epimerase/dehydratase family protein n=1 Tax=Salinirubrum litoreum TaxID=1126234 RepID=A0ABD5RDE4_9EURY|nr:NAD-dependent epimerase/dehydratase family protein [Salinirubrum litoreum]